MSRVRYHAIATGWRPSGTNAFAAAHGMGSLGENISFDFNNARALAAMDASVPQSLPPGSVNDPVVNAWNLPGDTPLTLDPNAPAIVAEQALHANDPAIYGGATTVPGVWPGGAGQPPSGTMAWLETNAGWIAGVLLAITILPGLLKKL